MAQLMFHSLPGLVLGLALSATAALAQGAPSPSVAPAPSAAATVAPLPVPLVFMRGVQGPGGTPTFRFAADESNLTQAVLGGVSAADVGRQNSQRIRAQLALYAQAQRLAGIDPPRPLYILVDPEATWVYARWGNSFVLQHPDGRKETVTSGFIHMGEKVDYVRQAHTQEVDREANRALLNLVNAHYQTTYKTRDPRAYVQHLFQSAPCAQSLPISDEPWPQFQQRLRDVYKRLDCDLAVFEKATQAFEASSPGVAESFETITGRRFRFTVGEGTTKVEGGLEVYVDGLPHDQFRKRLEGLVSDDLRSRGAPTPSSPLDSVGARQITQSNERRRTADGLADTFGHELGHLIHFQAGNGLGYGPVLNGLPGDGSSHSATTLSNPSFALVEGFAEAMAFSHGTGPTADDEKRALKIDYDASAGQLRQALNDELLQRVGRALRERNLLPQDGAIPLRTGPLDRTRPDEFAAALREGAANLGLTGEAFDTVKAAMDRDPALASLRLRHAYTAHLQDHSGQPKRRMDFLSSEASVAWTLHSVNKSLGGKFYDRLLPLFKAQHPPGLADLLEAYATRYPEDRVALYRAVSGASGGILVTAAQADRIAANPTLHIDLDRDGVVGGTNAAAAHPSDFPSESPTFGPVPGLAPGASPLVPTVHAPVPAGTARVAARPEPSPSRVAVPASLWESPVSSSATRGRTSGAPPDEGPNSLDLPNR